MHNEILVAIAIVVGAGMFSQWLAWRLRLPSILFLLGVGLLTGPIAEIILHKPILDVNEVLGSGLFPLVSASVAVILFEGGLSLRFRDIRGSGGVVRNLVSISVVVTWLISAGAAMLLFDFDIGVALLLGATLIVTGPTVIIPLLKQIRPKGRVASILRWEGIIIDPAGAVLAVLVFEELVSGGGPLNALMTLLATLVLGVGVGWLVAQFMVEVYRRYWVPDNLQSPITLGFVIAAFTVSNVLIAESGLLTVTVMGIVMANQKRFDIRQIVEFKETLQVLLLSVLFILLSARLSPDDLAQVGPQTFIFVLIIIFIERPLAVFLSTLGSDLTWRERLFIAWMAPRGIVAASVASIFAIELAERPGFENADSLVPVTFAVIIGTVATYSLTAGPLARVLGLSERNPQGLLIIGASPWIRQMAQHIQRAGFRVVLSDTNQLNAEKARAAGLEVYHGNILSELAKDEIDYSGLGRLLAMTSNAEVNALAGEHFHSTFSAQGIYELQRDQGADGRHGISSYLGGRILFPEPAKFADIEQRFQSGARVMTVTVADVQEVQRAMPNALLPLFVMPDDERLQVWTLSDPPRLHAGNRIIALVESEYFDDLVERGAIDVTADSTETPKAPQAEGEGVLSAARYASSGR